MNSQNAMYNNVLYLHNDGIMSMIKNGLSCLYNTKKISSVISNYVLRSNYSKKESSSWQIGFTKENTHNNDISIEKYKKVLSEVTSVETNFTPEDIQYILEVMRDIQKESTVSFEVESFVFRIQIAQFCLGALCVISLVLFFASFLFEKVIGFYLMTYIIIFLSCFSLFITISLILNEWKQIKHGKKR